MSESRLFKPLRIGNIEVQHRIGMAPLTRLRATADGVPVPLMKEYYSQRASVPGTLLISEATAVSFSGSGGFSNAPGLWTDAQVDGWRTITDEVHSKGSYIFAQIVAGGRAAKADISARLGLEVVGPSAIPIDADAAVPRSMTIEEIEKSIQDFVTAAENAIKAGFDGVELHGANGYLIDQFIQDVSNQRDDRYGGSVENRSRFVVEVMEAVSRAIGPERVGLRLSPWSTFQSMKMADPVPQFSDIVKKAGALNLAYLHFIEARVSGSDDTARTGGLDFVYDLWNGPLLVAGGHTPATARALVEEEHPDKDILVVFGRQFISNPDLVYRIKEGLELNPYDRNTFYTPSSAGYVDYAFSQKYLVSQQA
ncbi:NADH:flavin oxidoreductase/NADH oxidase family protein-like protein [Nemania sp. FL0916]|nr:NADH:flavin oxidoreductase/NADH oxidase family protein-like protein [Nemania sp. FL0916]